MIRKLKMKLTHIFYKIAKVLLLQLSSLIIMLFSSICFGQRSVQSFMGARSMALGSMSISLDGADALIHNFANIIENDKVGTGLIAGSEIKFGLEELTTSMLGLYSSVDKFGYVGIKANNYGFEAYRETKLSLAYARRLDHKMNISVNFDWNNIRLGEYGQNSFFSMGIGLSGLVSEGLYYNIYYHNFENSAISHTTDSESFLAFGLRHKVAKYLKLFLECEKQSRERLNIKLGIEYMPVPNLLFRMGTNTEPGAFSAGFSYTINNKMILDAAGQFDLRLGTLYSATLKYELAR
jgi:hypothetical protein